jgi:MFS family permease
MAYSTARAFARHTGDCFHVAVRGENHFFQDNHMATDERHVREEEQASETATPEPGGEQSRLRIFWEQWPALHSFRYRDFRWLWLSTFSLFTAVGMEQITRGWLILRLTGDSPFALSLVMMSFALPLTFASLLGGALADRFSRRHMIMLSQSVNAAMALLLATLDALGIVHFWHLMVLGCIDGTMAGLNMPSRQSIISDIVPVHGMMNAVSLSSAAMNMTRIVGPSLAGVLIVYLGTTGVFYLIAVVYGIAILFTSLISVRKKAGEGDRKGIAADIIEGFGYARSNPTLLGLLILCFVPALFGFPYIALLPAWAREALHAQADGLGFLMMMMGIGSLAGTLILASLRYQKRRGMFLVANGFLWGLSLVIFSRSFSYGTALPTIFLLGLMSAVFMSLNMTLVQQYSSIEMRGRVISMVMMTFGIMPLSAVPFGAIAERIGTADSLQIAGLLLSLFTVIFFFANRRFRAVD